eukprot:TRINITY_DN56777_c0_g1_i1.p1 TRINITY_DN56777_c0_g1~~TRINITY_DN56777_c0_g1_i1.p1  ORF type:complete len:634 (-),score=110.85 TRINITY_DN56777_c0_g1_i1:27-1928(-)
MATTANVPPVNFVQKVFSNDRPSREAFVLLAPEFRSCDLRMVKAADIGLRMAEIGDRLYREGSLPGLPTWEMEESPEFVRSIAEWRKALEVAGCEDFMRHLRNASKNSMAAYFQMGKLVPSLAALRWMTCMKWLEFRGDIIDAASVGGAFGSLNPTKSYDALVKAKEFIFHELREILAQPEAVAMIDYDLKGHGVWHRGGCEPLPEEATNEWYRRGVEFDLSSFCLQSLQLPPMEINETGYGPPIYLLKQPLGKPDWSLGPQDSPRHVLLSTNWGVELSQSPFDNLPAKQLVQGMVLQVKKPPAPVFDLNDPEILEKIQRREDLGKGDQEDGLPGAIHGSVGLFYAALCAVEKQEHIRIYPDILPIEGFIEYFLRYSPPLRSLDFGGCAEKMTAEILQFLPLAGESLVFLDLEECNLSGEHVDVLVSSLQDLRGLRHVDLTGNNFDGPAAVRLLSELSERRVDVFTIRFDDNPLGDRPHFRDAVTDLLVKRGGGVAVGGEIVSHLHNDSVSWSAGVTTGCELHDAMASFDEALNSEDGAGEPRVPCTAIKDIERHVKNADRKMEEEAEASRNPEAVKLLPNFLARRQYHQKILRLSLVNQARHERACAAKAKEEEGERTDTPSTAYPGSPKRL